MLDQLEGLTVGSGGALEEVIPRSWGLSGDGSNTNCSVNDIPAETTVMVKNLTSGALTPLSAYSESELPGILSGSGVADDAARVLTVTVPDQLATVPQDALSVSCDGFISPATLFDLARSPLGTVIKFINGTLGTTLAPDSSGGGTGNTAPAGSVITMGQKQADILLSPILNGTGENAVEVNKLIKSMKTIVEPANVNMTTGDVFSVILPTPVFAITTNAECVLYRNDGRAWALQPVSSQSNTRFDFKLLDLVPLPANSTASNSNASASALVGTAELLCSEVVLLMSEAAASETLTADNIIAQAYHTIPASSASTATASQALQPSDNSDITEGMLPITVEDNGHTFAPLSFATTAATSVGQTELVAESVNMVLTSTRAITPTATTGGSDITFMVSGGSDRSAGYVGTLLITVVNMNFAMEKQDIITITLPPNTWTLTTYYEASSSRCSFASGTISSVAGALNPLFADQVSFQTSIAIPSTDGIIKVECTNVKFPQVAVSSGVNDGTPAVRVNRGINTIVFTRDFGTFTSVYAVNPADLGALYRQFTFDQYGQMSVLFSLPFALKEDEVFYLSLESSWYKGTSSVNCSINFTPARSSDYTIEGTRAVIRATLPGALSVAATTINILSCGNIFPPKTATAKQAIFAALTSLTNPKTRARTEKLDIPELKGEVGSTLFESTLSALKTGENTTLTVAIQRFPVRLESGSTIKLTLPSDLLLMTDESTCTLAQYPGEGFVDRTTVYNPIAVSSEILKDGFMLLLAAPASSANIISRIICVGVTPTVAYEARTVLSLTVTPMSGEAMTKTGGRIPTITSSEMGLTNRAAAVSNNKAGGISDMTLTAKPIRTALLQNDTVTLALDTRFGFSSTSRCTMTVSNDGTNYMNQGGDYNIAIDTTTTFSSTVAYRVVLKITETRERQLALIYRASSSINIQCTDVKNPPHETAGLSDITVTSGTSDFKTKSSFTASILTQIEPGVLGQTSHRILHSAPWVGQIGTLTVSINALTNPVPSAFEGGSIQFQMPLSWSFNALLQASACTISGNYPSGTTTIITGYMYHTITFAPNTGLVKGAYTLTCTNVKVPSQTASERNDLAITTYKDQLRIDVQPAGILGEVYLSRPADFVRASIIHNIIFQKSSQFSSTERAVLKSIYNDIVNPIQCSSEFKSQSLADISGFTPPSRIVEISTSSADTGGAVPDGDKWSSDIGLVPDHELAASVSARSGRSANTLRATRVSENYGNNIANDDDDYLLNHSESDAEAKAATERRRAMFARITGAQSPLAVSTVHTESIMTIGPKATKYLTVSTYVNTTSPDIGLEDIALQLTTQFTTLNQRIYSSLGYKIVDLVPDNDDDGNYPLYCSNDEEDEDETDVDCGGGSCRKCGHAKKCSGGSDCQSGRCVNNLCEGGTNAATGTAVSSNVMTYVAVAVAAVAAPLIHRAFAHRINN